MADPAPGEHFGEFLVERELARGATGVVYLAWQQRLSRHVTLKLPAPHRAGDPGWRAHFLACARAQARVQHPALCPVLGFGEVGGTPYLVMPHLPGTTLAEQLAERRARGRPPDAREVAALLVVFEDVAAGLARLHGTGFVHGDVKPANILATNAGRGVLIDFGLLRPVHTGDRGLVTELMDAGTPAYLAPECLRDAGTDSSRGVHGDRRACSDVYALAVVLYECLTLRPPFAAASRAALYRAILQDAPPPARALNRAVVRVLDVLLAAGMEKDPARRVPSAGALAEDLRRVRLGLPILARSLPLALRARRFVCRHPLPSALLALLVLSQALLIRATWAAERARLAAGHEMAEVRRTLDDVDLLAKRLELRAARERAAALVPPWPERLAALQSWTRQHRSLLALRGRIDRARRMLAAETATAAAAGARAQPWLASALARFAEDLERFERDTWRDVQRRLAWARRLQQLDDGPPAELWRRTIDEVRASPRYGGLVLAKQPGLVPLGCDPHSGLHEFYDPSAAGDGPMWLARDAHGRLVRDSRQGLVFVLLPGGTAHIGAQRDDPAAPYHDPDPSVVPLREVRLDPFLLSKYEMTRWQWRVVSGGEEPSELSHAALGYGHAEHPELLLHPVQQVSLRDCEPVLRRIGATLPTAAQWEYACRAGTTTLHYAGARPAQLAGHENVSDRPDVDRGPQAPVDGFADGWRYTAPVGALRPNAFGLHDMLGNVAEWCRDRWAAPEADADVLLREGDGLREPPRRWVQRVVRGGSFADRVGLLGSARGHARSPETRRVDFGLRPARVLWQARVSRR